MNYPSIIFKIPILCLLALLIATGCSESQDTAAIKLGGQTYSVEVAASNEARKKGLMYRKNLDKNKGMLFVYPEEKQRHFYMKNTFIPLDIAFINKDKTIIDIQQMKPLDETIIRSKQKAQYALETNRGFFNRIGVSVGDRISFVGPAPDARQ